MGGLSRDGLKEVDIGLGSGLGDDTTKGPISVMGMDPVISTITLKMRLGRIWQIWGEGVG